MRPASSPDPSEIKIGQVWQDNDKRSRGRTVTITDMEPGFVYYTGIRPARSMVGLFRQRFSLLHESSCITR